MAARTSSLVHPKYKTKYSVKNWPEYEQALRDRGDVTIWFSEDAIVGWIPRGRRRRGAQRRYSDLAIETALTLRLLFRLPLRQAEGFVASLLRLMDLDLGSPDHTTLSRRAKQLEIELPVAGKRSSIHLVVDSTGLQIVGHGPWAAAKHGGAGTREWRKLHVGVDQSGVIVAEKITDSNVDDASVVPDLVGQVHCDKKITRFTADGAYDQSSVYETFAELGATVVVPPVKTAAASRRRTRAARARNRTVRRVRKVGRRKWKKETRYHRQARVENTFFRYKELFGGRLRSLQRDNQETEARLGCKILNRMLQLGAPRSEPIRA
jgi:hypothetical protein